MKKLLLSFSLVMGGIGTLCAQEKQEISIENWCHTSHVMNKMKADPANADHFAKIEAIVAKDIANGVSIPKGTVYTIPIVFHIVHNGGDENISEEQIYNALDVINRDFRLQNADTASILPQFQPLLQDVEIQFALATKSPNGICFPGYTRTQSITTFTGGGLWDGIAQVDAIQSGNNVDQTTWPGDEYLNVFVVADCGGAGGYTTKPDGIAGASMYNGIWILYTQFGEIGESSSSAGRSLTHELGHWFGLSHTWGDTNDPGLASNCNENDVLFTDDTPNCTGGAGGCNLNDMGCGVLANAQNYMDYYLPCQSMFTAGQVEYMRYWAISPTSGRNNLWTTQNLNNTGAGQLVLCQAEFEADRTTICAGDSIQFTDLTYNAATGWDWTFDGGLPATSTQENPTVIYNTPGIYEVELTATDGSSNDTETKTAYIRVLPASYPIPIMDGFEPYTSFNGLSEWEVVNDLGAQWEVTTTAGLNSSKSAKLANLNQTVGTIDELIHAPVDLSGVSGTMTLSFRYAYKRKNSSDDDYLRVKATADCGEEWLTRKTLHGQQINTETQSSAYTPSSESDWTTVHITNITSQFWTDKFRFKFEFEAGGGNNIYLDNINIYEGAPSDDLVIGLSENEGIAELSVYPNPTEDELSVRFSVNNAQQAILEVQDLSGKITQRNVLHANAGSNIAFLDTRGLAQGMYFLRVSVGGTQETVQFVVK